MEWVGSIIFMGMRWDEEVLYTSIHSNKILKLSNYIWLCLRNPCLCRALPPQLFVKLPNASDVCQPVVRIDGRRTKDDMTTYNNTKRICKIYETIYPYDFTCYIYCIHWQTFNGIILGYLILAAYRIVSGKPFRAVDCLLCCCFYLFFRQAL